jgi:hypothetical protein
MPVYCKQRLRIDSETPQKNIPAIMLFVSESILLNEAAGMAPTLLAMGFNTLLFL